MSTQLTYSLDSLYFPLITMKNSSNGFLLIALMLLWQPSLSQKFFDTSVKKVLFLGNSITYSGEYIQLFETIYRIQNPESKVEFYNCGLPSETVSGLSEEGHASGRFPRPVLFERLDRVLKMIQPDIVIATYGINDGIYQPFSEERFMKFQEGIQKLHKQVEASGAKIIHVTPSVYEEKKKGFSFNYADVMNRYAEWLISQKQWEVIDTYFPMKKTLDEAKKKNPEATLASDGVHPNSQGHWVICRNLLAYFGLKKARNVEVWTELYPNRSVSNLLLLFQKIQAKHNILKNAWLRATQHTRPEMPEGLPMDEALSKAMVLQTEINTLLK